MTGPELSQWRARMGWTAKRASQELGLSVNGYAAYERGYMTDKRFGMISVYKRTIPRHVALACQLLEQMQKAS